MISTKRLTLSILFLALAGIFASASAQIVPPVGPPIRGGVVNFNAIELSDGFRGVDQKGSDSLFGYSFLGEVSGNLPGTFTLSMNCTPGTSKAGETVAMTGGMWAFPIRVKNIKGEVYSGSLYGTVDGGTMTWDFSHSTAAVTLTMSITGGTQMWLGARGTATFQGSIDETKTTPTLIGNLTFTFQ